MLIFFVNEKPRDNDIDKIQQHVFSRIPQDVKT